MLTWKPSASGTPLYEGEVKVKGADPVLGELFARNPQLVGVQIYEQLIPAVQASRELMQLFGVLGDDPSLVYTTGQPRKTSTGASIPFSVYLPRKARPRGTAKK